MRYSVYDPPKQEVGIAVNNQRLLTVDDPYSQGRSKYAHHSQVSDINGNCTEYDSISIFLSQIMST